MTVHILKKKLNEKVQIINTQFCAKFQRQIKRIGFLNILTKNYKTRKPKIDSVLRFGNTNTRTSFLRLSVPNLSWESEFIQTKRWTQRQEKACLETFQTFIDKNKPKRFWKLRPFIPGWKATAMLLKSLALLANVNI